MRRLTERLLNEFYSEPNSAFIEKFRKGGGGLLRGSCLILQYSTLFSLPDGVGFHSSWQVWLPVQLVSLVLASVRDHFRLSHLTVFHLISSMVESERCDPL
jgi:hypothetical protein